MAHVESPAEARESGLSQIEPRKRVAYIIRQPFTLVFVIAFAATLYFGGIVIQKYDSLISYTNSLYQAHLAVRAQITSRINGISPQLNQLNASSQALAETLSTIPQNAQTAAALSNARKELAAVQSAAQSIDTELEGTKSALIQDRFSAIPDVNVNFLISPAFAQASVKTGEGRTKVDLRNAPPLLWVCFFVPLVFAAAGLVLVLKGRTDDIIKTGLDAFKYVMGFYVGAASTLFGVSMLQG